MVKRILTFLNKEFHGINEAALLLGGFAFLSQLLGLFRDRILAHNIGVGPILDIYYAAFRIPDFLYISIASLASVTVLMPFVVKRLNVNSDSKEQARRFINNIFSSYMLFIIIASFIIAILMPYLVRYIAPGFTEDQLKSLVTTSRIMLFSPIFIGLSNLFGTITQLFKNFLIFSLSPIFYNIGILLGIIFLYPIMGVYGLGVGVILGAMMHLLIQVPVIIKNSFFPKFILKINWKEVWDVIKISLPRTLTLSCNSIAFMVLIAMASTIKTGSISLFTFSYNLQSVPVGIIGISYSVAAFPILVRTFSSKDMRNFINQIISASRQIIFWSLPVMVLLIVLRAQIVRVILGSNSFSWADTRLTAAAVALFVVSLVSQGLVLLFVRGYYASGNTKKPLIVNVLSSTMVVIFAFIFVNIFRSYPNILSVLESVLRVHNVPGTIMLALPLSYALGSILNLCLIWILFKKDFFCNTPSDLSKTFMQSLLGSLVMGIVTYFSLNIFDNIFSLNTGIGIFLQGLFSGAMGIIFGIFVLSMMKNKELEDISRTLSHKFWKNRIIAPEQGEL